MKSKHTFWLAVLLSIIISNQLIAQCDLFRPSIQVRKSEVNSDGNCEVTFNLAFNVDFNNGSKKTYIHIWLDHNYPNPAYDYHKAPTTTLDSSIATIIIDNQLANYDPPQNPVFISTYTPYPAINETVLDESDGITFNRSHVGGSIYTYQLRDIKLTLPDICYKVETLRGDVWATQANSDYPKVHCTGAAFDLLAEGPIIKSDFTCLYPDNTTENEVEFSAALPSDNKMIFDYDIYVDQGDGYFSYVADHLVFSSTEGPYFITLNQTYTSGNITYTYPEDMRENGLFLVMKNIKFIRGGTNDTTTIENIFARIMPNTCGTPLPISEFSFYGNKSSNNSAVIFWKAVEGTDIMSYDLYKSNDTRQWKHMTSLTAAGNHKLNRYNAIDPDLQSINYYRLNINKNDGSYETSKIVRIEAANPNILLNVYPNPATVNKSVGINISTDGQENPYSLSIYAVSYTHLTLPTKRIV